MTKIIVGLSGKKGVGKDTLASILTKNHHFTRFALGDYVKDIIEEVLHVPRILLYSEELKDRELSEPIEFKEYQFEHLLEKLEYCAEFNEEDELQNIKRLFLTTKFITPRQIMQFVATDIVRDYIGYDTWIDMLRRDLEKTTHTKIVVTDCRMANERKLIKDLGGKLGLVVRDNSINKDDTHFSENDLGEVDEYDYIFSNNSEMSSFISEIDLWATLKYS